MLASLTGCSERADSKSASSYHRPTQAEVQNFVATIPGLTPSGVRPQVINLPRGRKMVHFGDSVHQNVVIARRNPDGTNTIACVDTQEEAQSFLMGARDGSTKKAVR